VNEKFLGTFCPRKKEDAPALLLTKGTGLQWVHTAWCYNDCNDTIM
jgi:hypothetical protein